MRNVLRWSLDSLAITCLLLAAGAAALWARSERPHPRLADRDNLTLRAHDPRYWLISERGRVIFCRQAGRNWDHPLRKVEMGGIRFGGLWGERSMLWNLEVPYGYLIGLACVFPLARAFAWRARRRDKRRLRRGLCRHCGYDLRGNGSGVCPECGNAAAVLTEPTRGRFAT